METEALTKEVHTLVMEIFHNSRRGYCWLKHQFGDTRMGRLSGFQLGEMAKCLRSKKEGTHCPTHSRVHGA